MSDTPKEASTVRQLASFAITLAAAVGVCVGAARPPRPGGTLNQAKSERDRLPRVEIPAPSAAPRAQSVANELLPQGQEAASCAINDPGGGNFAPWVPLPIGKVTWSEPKVTETYDLIVHFHGGEPARRVLSPFGMRVVLATVDLGEGSGRYESTFNDPAAFDELLASVDAVMAPAQRRRLILTSWSAGYGAIRAITRQSPALGDGVVLLDSVHAGYAADGRTPDASNMEPFVGLLQRTQAQDVVMVLTHSSIRPPGYASTTETADYLIAELDGQRRYAGLVPQFGVQVKTRFDQRTFHVRGTTGSTKAAHCAHLRMLGTVLDDEVFPALGLNPY